MNGDPDLAALHRRGTAPPDRAGCPSAEALFSLLGPAASPAERERLVDHVAACSACAEELRLMRSLGPWSESLARRLAEAGEALDIPPPRPFPARRGLFRPLALAAALAAALVGGGVLFRQHLAPVAVEAPVEDPVQDVERGTAPAEVSPAPDSVLPAPPETLQWPSQAGAMSYRVKLYDEEARLLWQSGPSRQPRAVLPPAVRDRLHPGADYFWVIELEGPVPRRQLGAFWFRLEGTGNRS